MSSGFATPSLNWETPDIPNAFRSFRQYCNLIFEGPYSAKSEREKVTFLLLWTGRHGIDLYNSWTWNSPEDKHKLDAVWKKFSDHIEPKVNAYLARFQLSQLKQHSDEAVDDFIARCRVAAAKCKFADIVEMNTRLIEQLIIGTQHDYVRGKLLERGDGLASLEEAMDIARTFETTKAHVAQFQSYGSSSSSSATVHGLRRETTHEGCTRCGRRHPAQGFCPAKGSTCRRCGRKNHWDIVCTETDQTAEKEGRHHGYQRSSRGAAKSSHVRGKATVSTIDECPDVDADSMVFETISMHMDSMGDAQNSARDQAFVNLALRDVIWNGRQMELRAKVDTGAQGNVLPLRIYQKMFPDRVDKGGQPIRNFLEKSSVRLVSYGGTLINQIGVCTLTCTYQQTRRKTRFFVTDAPGPAIIGLPSLEAFKIISLNCEIKETVTRSVAGIHPQFTGDVITRLKTATQQDEELTVLREVISQGWPDQRKEAPTAVHGYWNYRDELAIEDGLIVKGECIVIPRSMIPDILEQLHSAHQGGEKMKLRARSTVFWTGITKDIDNTVSRCTQCPESQPRQRREPMSPSEVPPRAWHTVGADLFTLNGEYLVVVDYYSKYPFVFKLSSTERYSIVEKLKNLFSEQGIPAILRTGNGPQFVSHKFQRFAEEFGFQHTTSSPYHPHGNGFIESQVKIVKQALSKALKNGQDPAMALLCLRTTPIDQVSSSPAEILLGRRIQDNLPRRFNRKPEDDQHYQRLHECQEEQKRSFDQHVRPLPMVVPGQSRQPEVTVSSPVKTIEETESESSVSMQPEATVSSPVKTLEETESESSVSMQPEATVSSPIKTLEETESSPTQEPETRTTPDSLCTTRSGRVVKQPVKLNL